MTIFMIQTTLDTHFLYIHDLSVEGPLSISFVLNVMKLFDRHIELFLEECFQMSNFQDFYILKRLHATKNMNLVI
jgi:hypothetical protein